MANDDKSLGEKIKSIGSEWVLLMSSKEIKQAFIDI